MEKDNKRRTTWGSRPPATSPLFLIPSVTLVVIAVVVVVVVVVAVVVVAVVVVFGSGVIISKYIYV
jgi:hypothetical protein